EMVREVDLGEFFTRLVEVVLPRVVELEARRHVEVVTRRLVAGAVELLGNQVALNGKRQGFTGLLVLPDRVLSGRLGARAVDLGVRVGELDHDALSARPAEGNQRTLAALFLHLLEDLRLDLQVPGPVRLARHHDGTSCRGSITATLKLDLVE